MTTNDLGMVGETLTDITGMDRGSDSVHFSAASGRRWHMFHAQDCCETVEVEDVCGDVGDLLHSPLVTAEEVSSDNEPPPQGRNPDSYTWTFYRFATARGSVTLRWFGSSNGYYSESVSMRETKQGER